MTRIWDGKSFDVVKPRLTSRNGRDRTHHRYRIEIAATLHNGAAGRQPSPETVTCDPAEPPERRRALRPADQKTEVCPENPVKRTMAGRWSRPGSGGGHAHPSQGAVRGRLQTRVLFAPAAMMIWATVSVAACHRCTNREVAAVHPSSEVDRATPPRLAVWAVLRSVVLSWWWPRDGQSIGQCRARKKVLCAVCGDTGAGRCRYRSGRTAVDGVHAHHVPGTDRPVSGEQPVGSVGGHAVDDLDLRRGRADPGRVPSIVRPI